MKGIMVFLGFVVMAGAWAAPVKQPVAQVFAEWTFQTIDAPASLGPGAAVEIAWIADNGLISVQYQTPQSIDWYANTHAAVIDRGVWKNVDVPGAAVTLNTNPNARGQLALTYTKSYPADGVWVPGSPEWHVVIYDRGRLIPVELPGYQLVANAINDKGELALAAMDANYVFHGAFGRPGNLTVFDVTDPVTGNPVSTQTLGINNGGQVAGSFYTDDGHGFVLDQRGVTPIDLPGVKWTNAVTISNNKLVAGSFGNKGPDGLFDHVWHGFVIKNGDVKVIDVPGASPLPPDAYFYNGTVPYWVNDLGQVSGQYLTSDGKSHGFIATPVPGKSR